MLSRRGFLAGSVAAVTLREGFSSWLSRLPVEQADPEDELFWAEFRKGFYHDPELTVFNHVGVCPTPSAVLEAQIREAKRAASDPSFTMWRKQDAELAPIRQDLADLIGCPVDDLALVPNASYGLQTVLTGLHLNRGDAILLPNHEYPRSETAAKQRARRDGVVYQECVLPCPIVDGLAASKIILDALTPHTKLVVLSHVSYLTGQILPVAEITRRLAERGVDVLVDGAQAIGVLSPPKAKSIYVACLHKWMMGPIATGIMVMGPEVRKRVWALHPADPELDDKMSKFEQVGTHATAPFLALRESLEIHYRLGQPLKLARLLYLRKRLYDHFSHLPGVQIQGSLNGEECAPFLSVKFAKVPSASLAGHLMAAHKIHVTTVVRKNVDGIRISPNLFTSADEVDRLGTILHDVAVKGL